MPACRLGAVLGVVALLAAGAEDAGASTPGALSELPGPGGCLEQDVSFLSIGAEGCGGSARGLLSAATLAISPDGRDVYVVTGDAVTGEVPSNSVVELSRNPEDGALTQFGCISKTGAECDLKADGLGSDDAIAVSPDGSRVYVGSPSAGVDVFERAGDGALTLLQCFKRTSDSGDSSCTTVPQLEGVRGFAVSADGKFVYVAEQNGNAIGTFARTASNTLEFNGCISEEEEGGLTTCAATKAVGLLGVTGLALSPDGERLYAVSYGGNALVTFARNPTTGALTYSSCESGPGGASGCGTTNVAGLANAQNVAVNAAGTRIYVVTLEGALSTFSPTGSGTVRVGCLSAGGKEPTCTPAGANLAGGTELVLDSAIAPGGATLYTSSLFAKAVNAFAIEPTSGLPVPLPGGEACLEAPGAGSGCAASAPGLNSPSGIAASPDGSDIYVASRGLVTVQCGTKKCEDGVSAVTGFARAQLPVPILGSGSPPGSSGVGAKSAPPAAPSLRHVRLAPGRIYRQAGRHHQPRSAELRYEDTQTATTTIVIERLASGVRHHGHCVSGHARSRTGRCQRYSAVASLTHHDAAGSNAVRIGLAIGRHRLVPGRYRLELLARSQFGLTSRSAPIALRVS